MSVKTLKSHVSGKWHQAPDGFVDLFNPSTEEVVGRASTAGIDFGAALAFARDEGGPALRGMTFAARGALLKGLAKAIHDAREELIDLSLVSGGTTRKDAKFDLDGASGTLAYYATLGKSLGDTRWLVDGDGEQLGRTARFWGQHVRVPRTGVAVHINAFNFPAWGFAEKAACALLAGMPVVTKPATSTAMLTERIVELIVDGCDLPPGALSFIAGSTGDLLERLGSQDVVAFTGSADTALCLRRGETLLARGVSFNTEADSLNAAVLAPDVDTGDDTWDLFVNEVSREITQKSGQKCTAVRRIFVPAERSDDVVEALTERLGAIVTGNPAAEGVNMGPLASARQLQDAIDGVRKLRDGAELVHGTGERVDGVGAAAGKGYFFAPCLLRAPEGSSDVIHTHEVFGPVSTVIPYDGSAAGACAQVACGGGTLVTSVYSDDLDFVAAMIDGSGAWSGRLYLGSRKMAEQAPGSGIALPQCLHGGPGRAGGGEELGGLRALGLYTQRVSLQGSRSMLERLVATPEE